MKYLYLIIYSLLLGILNNSIYAQNHNYQIVMSERIQYSQLATPDDKQLFLIDFWATWCGPCITVSKYLNGIQAKYAKELYVVSLSEENPEVVKKFLKRHPSKLAVSLDYDSKNFKQHHIKALPSGVLLNADGNVVWRGNPADLKERHIEQFLHQNRKTIPVYEFLHFQAYETEVTQSVEIDGDYQLSQIAFEVQTLPAIEQVNDHLTSVKGSLRQILAFLLGVSQKQIQINHTINRPYQLIINQKADKNNVFAEVKKQLHLSSQETQKTGEILEVILISYDSLWDKTQINWGFPNSKFLIDDTQITADNMSLREILALIADLHHIPIILMNQNRYINSLPYDWQIHYRFKDLLVSNLNDYGFKTNIRNGNYPVFIFN